MRRDAARARLDQLFVSEAAAEQRRRLRGLRSQLESIVGAEGPARTRLREAQTVVERMLEAPAPGALTGEIRAEASAAFAALAGEAEAAGDPGGAEEALRCAVRTADGPARAELEEGIRRLSSGRFVHACREALARRPAREALQELLRIREEAERLPAAEQEAVANHVAAAALRLTDAMLTAGSDVDLAGRALEIGRDLARSKDISRSVARLADLIEVARAASPPLDQRPVPSPASSFPGDPAIYRKNPFRVRGILAPKGARAPEREATPSPLPLADAATAAELRSAAATIREPQARLPHELLWFWRGGEDPGLDHLIRGNVLDAARLWRESVGQPGGAGEALHNLAVLYLHLALDADAGHEASGLGDAESLWGQALGYWAQLEKVWIFWALLQSRARAFGSDGETAWRLRADLPAALLRLALRRGREAVARRPDLTSAVADSIRAAGLNNQDLDLAVDADLADLRGGIAAATDPGAVLALATSSVVLLDALLKGDERIASFRDGIARTVQHLAEGCRPSGSSLDGWGIEPLRASADLALEPSLREAIAADLEDARRGFWEAVSAGERLHDLAECVDLRRLSENFFRITKLPVTATRRDMERHLERIRMAERLEPGSRAAPGDPDARQTCTYQQQKELAHQLRDLARRLVEEMLSPWPSADADALLDAATPSLAGGRRSDSKRLWRAQVVMAGCGHGPAALHNQAVRSLLELVESADPPAGAEGGSARREARRLWRRACRQWIEVIESDRLWEWMRARSQVLSDRHSDYKAVEQLRSSLALIILRMGGQVVFGQGPRTAEVSVRVRRWLSASGFASSEVDDALLAFAEPLLRQVRAAAKRAMERAVDFPSEGDDLARTLLRVAPDLECASGLLGSGNSRVCSVADDTAQSIRKCLLAWVYEADGSIEEALCATEAALSWTCLGSMREVLEGDVQSLRQMASSKDHRDLVNSLADRCEAITTAEVSGVRKYARLVAVFELLQSIQREIPGDSLEAGQAVRIVARACNGVAVQLHDADGEIALAVRILSYALALDPEPELASQLTQNLGAAEKTLARLGGRVPRHGRTP